MACGDRRHSRRPVRALQATIGGAAITGFLVAVIALLVRLVDAIAADTDATPFDALVGGTLVIGRAGGTYVIDTVVAVALPVSDTTLAIGEPAPVTACVIVAGVAVVTGFARIHTPVATQTGPKAHAADALVAGALTVGRTSSTNAALAQIGCALGPFCTVFSHQFQHTHTFTTLSTGAIPIVPTEVTFVLLAQIRDALHIAGTVGTYS